MRKRLQIGSYTRYFAYRAKRMTLETSWLILMVGSGLCCFGMVLGGIVGLLNLTFYPSSSATIWLGISLSLGFLAWALFKSATTASRASEKMEPVAPPMHLPIEQLPAEETLVRASQEPTERQEKVLLRAASASEEVKPDELLRATLES